MVAAGLFQSRRGMQLVQRGGPEVAAGRQAQQQAAQGAPAQPGAKAAHAAAVAGVLLPGRQVERQVGREWRHHLAHHGTHLALTAHIAGKLQRRTAAADALEYGARPAGNPERAAVGQQHGGGCGGVSVAAPRRLRAAPRCGRPPPWGWRAGPPLWHRRHDWPGAGRRAAPGSCRPPAHADRPRQWRR